MLEKLKDINIKKISIIALALIITCALILLVNYLIPSNGKSETNLSNTLPFNTTYQQFKTNIENNFGKYVTVYYSTYANAYYESNPGRDIYCLQHGNGFTSSMQLYVKYKYVIKNTNVTQYRKENGETKSKFVNDPLNIQYRIAMIHVMADAHGKGFDKKAPTSGSWDEGDRYKKAMWAIMNYYYNKDPNHNMGFANAAYTVNGYSGNTTYEYAQTARRAYTFAEFIYEDTKNPPQKNNTNINIDTSKFESNNSDSYIIVGPYNIRYTKKTDSYKNFNVTIGGLTGATYDNKESDSNISFCDINGNNIELTSIKSGVDFFVKVKQPAAEQNHTIKISCLRYNVNGTFYVLDAAAGYQNLAFYDNAGGTEEVEYPIVLEIPTIPTTTEYSKAKINLNWYKTDKDFNIINDKLSTFAYNLNGIENDTYESLGEFNKTIEIGKDIYQGLENSEFGKKYEIEINEENAPEGYEIGKGNIKLTLYLNEENSSNIIEGTMVKKTTLKVTKYTIENNLTTENIKFGTNEIITPGSKKSYEINANEYTIPNIYVVNKIAKYPTYELELNKIDQDNNLLNGAIFEVSIRDQAVYNDDSNNSVARANIYNVEVSGRPENSENEEPNQSTVLNGGFISNQDKDKLIVSNVNDIVKIKTINIDKAKMTLELKDIQYNGDIYIGIKENKAPSNEYNKIEKEIVLCISIADGEINSITEVSSDIPQEITINNTIEENKSKAKSTINFKNIKKGDIVGVASFRIQKLDDGNNSILDNVKFNIYNGNNTLLKEIITRQFALGDINMDGKITNADVSEISKYLAGIITFDSIQKELAEVDGDGEVSILDATRIQRYLSRIPEGLRGYCNNASDAFEVSYNAPGSTQLGDELSMQTFIIKEIETADGYVKLGENEEIKVSMQGKVVDDDGNLKVITKYIKIENNTSQNIRWTLDGTNYNLIIPNGTMEETNNNGIDTSNFIIGIYNTKAKIGTYTFAIKKVDSLDNTTPITGAEFALYSEEQWKTGVTENENQFVTVSTNANGIAEFTVSNLSKEGTLIYYIKEKEAAEGYKKLNDLGYIKLELTVKYNNTTNTYEVEKVKITNMLIENEILSDSCDITVNGENLVSLNKNISNANANVISRDDLGQSVEINNVNTLQITVKNEKKTEDGQYSIRINKKSARTNTNIAGAKFSLNNEENTAFTLGIQNNGTSDILKTITEEDFNNRIISYHIKEIEAPEGYKKTDGQIDIEVLIDDNNITYSATMTVTNNTTGVIKVNNQELEQNGSVTVEGNIAIDIYNEPQIDLALKKYIAKVNDTDISTQRIPDVDVSSLQTSTQAIYRYGVDKVKKTQLQPVEVKQGDKVIYGIIVYNEGQTVGQASLIKDYLPKGVSFDKNAEINRQYGWDISANEEYIYTTNLNGNNINRYNGGSTLDSRTIFVELEVTEPNMYIGILKNVAEIAEMKDENGNIVAKDIDSTAGNTVITRNGETINDKYNPTTIDASGKYYDDVAVGEDDVDFEIIKLKDPVLQGRIWLDINEPTTKNPPENDIIDNHEIISGEETYRQIVANGGFVAKLYKNGTYWKNITVNDDGTYEISVPKSDDGVNYNRYEIRYTYNGMDYTNVLKNAGSDNTINSKAAEIESERTAFNNKFGTINGQSNITYSSNQGKTISKYDITDNMKIDATTGTIALSMNTNAEDLQYYNLGLKRRPTFDLALIKDVKSATVTVNGQSETYEYDKFASFDPEKGAFNEFIVELRNSDFEDKYDLKVRDDDRPLLNSVITTYSLRILNQSSTYGEAKVIKDYFDSTIYDVNRVYVKNNEQEINITTYDVRNGVITITIPDHVIGNNQSYYVFVDLKVKDSKISELINRSTPYNPNNYAEICEYKTYTDITKSVPAGIIDINSAPDNYSNGYNENDTGSAPVIFIGVPDTKVRTLTGNVFEDMEGANNEYIEGVKVELIEIDANGAPIMEGENYRSRTYRSTITDQNGDYSFDHFLPGRYIIRFTYGDSEATVLTTSNGGKNAKSYNGQDFKSTSNIANNIGDYWYTNTEDERSDALDDNTRRYAVNSYSKPYTNDKSKILTSWEEDISTFNSDKLNEWKERVNELINNTYMYANTVPMVLSVEYPTDKILNDIKEYNVTGIDFGLEERPKNEIQLTKHVTKLTLKSSSGETLVEATPARNGNNVQWMQSKLSIGDGFVKIEQEDAVLNGANLEIEYTFGLKNTGECVSKVTEIVDYIDNNLRYDSDSNTGWEIVSAEELKSQGLVDDEIDLSNQQVILRASADNNLLNKDISTTEEFNETAILVLTKTLTTSSSVDDDLIYNNVAEILKIVNEEGIKAAGKPGNLNPNSERELESGEAKAESVTISNPTGQSRIYYVLGLTVAVIFVIGIVVIKKIVLDKRD